MSEQRAKSASTAARRTPCASNAGGRPGVPDRADDRRVAGAAGVFHVDQSSTEVLQSNQDITLAVAADANEKATGCQRAGHVNMSAGSLPWRAGSIEVSGKKLPDAGGPDADARNERYEANEAGARADPRRQDRRSMIAFLRGVMLAVGQANIGNVTFSVVDKETPK